MRARRAISLIFLLGGCLCATLSAQTSAAPLSARSFKPNITEADLFSWPAVSGAKISNDGKYFAYTMQPFDENGSRHVFVQALDGDWKIDLDGLSNLTNGSAPSVEFSADNQVVWVGYSDELCQIRVNTQDKHCIQDVGAHKSVAGWLAYQLKSDARELVLRQVNLNRETHFKDIAAYWINDAGTVLLLQSVQSVNGVASHVLEKVDLKTMTRHTLWSAAVVADQTVAIGLRLEPKVTAASPMVFAVTESHEEQSQTAIWYCRAGADAAQIKAQRSSLGIPAGYAISPYPPSLSRSGHYILFGLLGSTAVPKPLANIARVDIWNYRDRLIQDTQLQQAKEGPAYLYAAMGVDRDEVLNLGRYLAADTGNGPDWALAVSENCTNTDKTWQCRSPAVNLISFADGSVHPIRGPGAIAATQEYISPTGKYVVFYDIHERAYFSYEVATGGIANMSRGVTAGQFEQNAGNYNNDTGDNADFRFPVGLATWISHDDAVIVYDNFDLWKLDLRGVKAPVNISNGYGRAHAIELRLLDTYGQTKTSVQVRSALLLRGYDRQSKEGGFFKMVALERADPQLLSMGGGLSYVGGPAGDYEDPLKARDAQRWIVTRQSATEAPNYFVTSDFKTYKRITNLEPQKAYNWLTADLVQWKNPEGGITQGIVYKPEDFDPTRRYPVLFNYYEQRTQGLFGFPYPEETSNNINIPWFVSRGYVVVVPDIWAKIGEPGQGALSVLVSGAQYMAQFPWVDAKRMGIEGHSFGGYETNYIVTHSQLFAAACSASGIANMESFYGSLVGDGASTQNYVESDQGRMGVPLWEAPERYHRNSPLYDLKEVETPLLILANKQDGELFRQQVQVFMGLRRMDKRVWLLQYDDSGHSVNYGKDATDFTRRLTQFFDYYLKDAPPPKWMTEGVPARLKGIETGLELDTSGAVP